MAEWSQVFDNERVLTAVRRRARRVVMAFALASGGIVAAAPLSTLVWPEAAAAAAVGCGAVLTVWAAWVLRHLSHLHRTLWRVELSVGRVVGHDVGGRRVSIAWSALSAVDVRSGELVLSGRDDQGRRTRLAIPGSMPHFTTCARRAVEYAEAFGRPIHVEGQPWERLALDSLYPLVREGEAPTL